MLVVLGLIDVVMISNLLIMVIVGGYETFVSRMNLEGHPDQPEWLSHVNASVLKVKLAHRDHRHLVDPPAQDLHQRRGLRREGADRADRDPHHVPAVGDGDRGVRPHHAARPARRRQRTELEHRHDHDPRRTTSSRASPTRCSTSSYYHPADYIRAARRAPTSASSRPAAKDAIAQILTNSRMCAEGQPPDLPGHRHRQRVPEGRHGRALRDFDGVARGRGQRRRAPRLHRPGQQAARLDRRRPALRAQEHQRQHAGGDPHASWCPATRSRSTSRPRAAARRTSRSS